MIFPLFSEMNQKIKNDLDLNEETFIQPEELVAYFNEAIDMIEGQIHTLYEDYFLTSSSVDVTEGQSEVDLPSNIFANKIRRVMWMLNDSEKYTMQRVRNLDELLLTNAPDDYRYMITNSEAGGFKIAVSPSFRVTTANTPLKIWYLRNAKRYVDETSICDIPEYSNVINQYVRYKCHSKEGHPDAQQDLADLERLRTAMTETLRDKYIDEQNEVPKDLTFYRDFDMQGFYNFY
jgi:hypothetical protein